MATRPRPDVDQHTEYIDTMEASTDLIEGSGQEEFETDKSFWLRRIRKASAPTTSTRPDAQFGNRIVRIERVPPMSDSAPINNATTCPIGRLAEKGGTPSADLRPRDISFTKLVKLCGTINLDDDTECLVYLNAENVLLIIHDQHDFQAILSEYCDHSQEEEFKIFVRPRRGKFMSTQKIVDANSSTRRIDAVVPRAPDP